MRRVLAGLCLCLCLAALAAPPLAAAEDEVVPEGAWMMRLGVSAHTETQAFSRLHKQAPLLDYLVPDETVRTTLNGGVQRDVKRAQVDATYGLSDTWNLVLGLPYEQVHQSSTLSTASASADAQAAVDRLQSRTVSGAGRLQVGSLHRPVFTDRSGFVWGYGVDWPLEAPASPWAGRGTLLVDSPFPRLYGLLHYTFYPFIPRTHLDLRLELGTSVTRRLELYGGGHDSVNPGNDLMASMGWSQEFGRVATELTALVFRQGETRLNTVPQGDGVSSTSVRLMVGYGNLTELEQGPIAFPYQVQLRYQQVLAGYDLPLLKQLSLSLQFYF